MSFKSIWPTMTFWHFFVQLKQTTSHSLGRVQLCSKITKIVTLKKWPEVFSTCNEQLCLYCACAVVESAGMSPELCCVLGKRWNKIQPKCLQVKTPAFFFEAESSIFTVSTRRRLTNGSRNLHAWLSYCQKKQLSSMLLLCITRCNYRTCTAAPGLGALQWNAPNSLQPTRALWINGWKKECVLGANAMLFTRKKYKEEQDKWF